MSEWFWCRTDFSRLAFCIFSALHSVPFAAGGAAAADRQREPDLEMGARLVEARCVFCHNQKSLPELVDRCMAEHDGTYLDDFLKRHHAPDDQARADIIAYLTCPAPLPLPE